MMSGPSISVPAAGESGTFLLLQEGHAFLLQLFVGAPAIVGLEHASGHRSLCDQAAKGLRVRFAEHRRCGRREKDVDVGLRLGADGEPAESIHARVATNFESQLFRVELLGPVLVEDEYVHVQQLGDHSHALQ